MGLALLNMKGTKESGSFQVVITAAKVLLLIWFVIGGVWSVDGGPLGEKVSEENLRVGSTGAPEVIPVFRVSAIAPPGGEEIRTGHP